MDCLFNGINKVIDLLDNGYKLDDIIDSDSEPIDNDAKEFFSSQNALKSELIKKAYLEPAYRPKFRHLENANNFYPDAYSSKGAFAATIYHLLK